MKKLPIGISVLRQIREGNYIYIDKTEYAYNLIDQYKYTFLSRPRRFGKSLFLDTLQNIFEGNKSYLRGYIFIISGIGMINILLLKLVLVGI